jgi:DNA polymerase-3 subunit delta'
MAKGAAGRGRRGSAAEPEPGARPRLELVGHGEARRRVAAAAERGQLGPALLVTGPRGVGKETFAFWVARLLLCRAGGERPCGVCSSCTRIATLGHPDVHWFFPVPPESAPFGEAEWVRLLERIRRDPLDPSLTRFSQPASFRMHQASAIRRLAGARPFEDGARVFILGDYERNPSDQVHNALLKVLEEPPPRTTFVLTAARVPSLPETILSRCRRVRLGPLSGEEMETFLAQAVERGGLEPPAEAARRDALARAEGRPGRLVELLKLEDGAGAEAEELFRSVVQGGPLASYGHVLGAGFRGSREDHDRRLDALAALWRDLLRVASGAGDAATRPDLLDLYAEAAGRLDAQAAAQAALELERAREAVQANAYAPLVFWKVFRALALALRPARSAA